MPILPMDCPFHEMDHLLQSEEQREWWCGPIVCTVCTVCMYLPERNSFSRVFELDSKSSSNLETAITVIKTHPIFIS